MGIEKELLKFAFSKGPRLFPQVAAFARKWWWAILLGTLLMIVLGFWAAIAVTLWVWESLPHVVAYLINHFAPALEGLLPAPQPPTSQPQLSI